MRQRRRGGLAEWCVAVIVLMLRNKALEQCRGSGLDHPTHRVDNRKHADDNAVPVCVPVVDDEAQSDRLLRYPRKDLTGSPAGRGCAGYRAGESR